MPERTENPEKDEVTDEQLEAIAGGATFITKKEEIAKETTSTGSEDGESSDKDHNNWIDV